MVDAAARASAWVMLLALTAAFAMSQAFRTVAAILAAPLQAEFGLSPQQLGSFAGGLPLRLRRDAAVHGHRHRPARRAAHRCWRAFRWPSPDRVLSALAPGYATLLLGQVLIGIGCAPAFLVCTVFIARHFPVERFTALSGTIMSLGGIGLLAHRHAAGLAGRGHVLARRLRRCWPAARWRPGR